MKWTKKVFPTPYTSITSLNQWNMAGWTHAIILITPKFWSYHVDVAAELETHHTKAAFSFLLLYSFDEPVRAVASVYSETSDTQCCFLLLLAICFRIFRDTHLNMLAVAHGCLSYSCLLDISKPSDHSPLTPGINKGFLPKDLLLTGYFLFFSVNSSRSAFSATHIAHSKSLKLIF